MKRLATALVFCAVSGTAALSDVDVSGDLEKDSMKYYCVYDSHLYSIGADMCGSDNHVDTCVLDDKTSGRPVWKSDKRMCAASTTTD